MRLGGIPREGFRLSRDDNDASGRLVSSKTGSYYSLMPKTSNRTNAPGNILEQSSEAGGRKRVEKEGEVVKDFMIGKTRIKINDAYCRDKTPADVAAMLTSIANRAQEQLTAQELTKSSK